MFHEISYIVNSGQNMNDTILFINSSIYVFQINSGRITIPLFDSVTLLKNVILFVITVAKKGTLEVSSIQFGKVHFSRRAF